MEIDSSRSTESSTDLAAELVQEPAQEPDHFNMTNLSRVTPQQIKYISFPVDGKYQPISGTWRGEIVVLRDNDASKQSEFFEPSDIKVISSATPEDNEPQPPEPFKYPSDS